MPGTHIHALARGGLGLLLLLCLAYAGAGMASDMWDINHFRHTAWTSEAGAPGAAAEIVQTADGYLWISSGEGLFRFDGMRFDAFKSIAGQSLPSTQVQSLYAPPSGGLWIAYEGSGISFYKDGKLTNYDAKSGYQGGSTYTIVEDSNGNLLTDGYPGPMTFTHGAWHTLTSNSGIPSSKRVHTLFVDRDGSVWAGSGGKLLRKARNQSKFEDMDVKLTGALFTMVQLPDGSFVIGQNNGPVIQVKLINQTYVVDKATLPAKSAGMVIDKHGGLWIASLGDGVFHVNTMESGVPVVSPFAGQVQHFTKNDGLSGDYVWGAFYDREGNIWFATQNGIDRFRESNFYAQPLPDGIHDAAIAPGPHGSVWVGSSNYDVLHLTDKGYTKTAAPASMFALEQRSADLTLGAGSSGIWEFSSDGTAKLLGQLPIPHTHEKVGRILKDKRGQIWLTTFEDRAALLLLNGDTSRSIPVDWRVSPIFEDAEGNVWVGIGANHITSYTDKQEREYSEKNGLAVGRARIITEHEGHIWVAGERGIARITGSGFRSVHLASGVQWQDVSGLVFAHDGSLWIHNLRTIYRVAPEDIASIERDPTQNNIDVQSYGPLDGVPGPGAQMIPLPSATLGTDGRIWFATQSGVIWVDPARLIHNALPPPTVVTSMRANGKGVPFGPDIELKSNTRDIEISYTALSMMMPERVQYRYRLDGVDKGWRDGGTLRQTRYTNLSPGHYQFTVIASNNDGVWNQQGATIGFHLLPGPYQTWWFRLILALLVITLIALAFAWRLRAASRRLGLIMEGRDRERARIAGDIHDTLLQGMQGLLIHVKLLADAQTDNPRNRQLLNASVIMAQNTLIEGRDRIVALKSAGQNTRDILSVIDHIGIELSAIHGNAYRSKATGLKRAVLLQIFDQVIDIAREATLNAFMHAHASLIECTVAYEDDTLRVIVQDNGRGIDPDVLAYGGRPGHWGLESIRSRSEKIGATPSWIQRESGGTTFTLEVPNRAAFGDSWIDSLIRVLTLRSKSGQ